MGNYLSQIYRTATASLPDDEAAVIMDHGCGGKSSRSLAHLSKRGTRLIGVDRCPTVIREAQAKYPAATFVQANEGRIAVGSATVDAVFSGFCLNEAATREILNETVAEICRTLRVGGGLTILTLNPDALDIEFPGHITSAPHGRWIGAPLVSKQLRTGKIHQDYLWDESFYRETLRSNGFTGIEVSMPRQQTTEVNPFMIMGCRKSG